jgi:hypothetical protein
MRISRIIRFAVSAMLAATAGRADEMATFNDSISTNGATTYVKVSRGLYRHIPSRRYYGSKKLQSVASLIPNAAAVNVRELRIAKKSSAALPLHVLDLEALCE